MKDSSDSDAGDDDYSSSDGSIDSDLGYDGIRDTVGDTQKYEDDTKKIAFYDYKYCVSRDPDAFK